MGIPKTALALILTAWTMQQPAPLPRARHNFIIISHRGNHVQAPENTLAAFEAAIRAGADYAEMDLRTTKDGYLVLSHDATVNRMTDGSGSVKDLTLAEIKKLKVKNPNQSDTAVYRIPEFKDVLNVCKDRINIYLDFKDADVEETYQQIKAAGMEKQVVVYLNKKEQYGQWKKAAPEMPLMTSIPETVKSPEALNAFLEQVQIAVVDNAYDSSMAAIVHRHGIAIWLDVEGPRENPPLWNQALSKGIEGMQTDHPEALAEYLDKTGRRRR